MTAGVQIDLFARRRTHDEAALLARLKSVENDRRFLAVNGLGTFSRAEVRRLMRPLPPITVPR